MNNKSILITGGKGDERQRRVKDYIEEALNEEANIIIYDATYFFVCYAKNPCVHYYCVDTVGGFLDCLNKLKQEKENGNKDKYYIVTDAYGALMLTKSNANLFYDLLVNKKSYNVEILMNARHISFVPESIISLFDERVELEEVYTPLANGK